MKFLVITTLAFALIFSNGSALAHVEKNMPDSVAEMEYRILLEFKPGDFNSRIKLGMVLLNQNKLNKAEKELRKALKSSPASQQAHIGLSLVHLKRKEPKQALEVIKTAVNLNPEQGVVYLYYGKILESDSRLKEALQMYKLGLGKLDTSPESEDSHHLVKFNTAIQEIELKIKESVSN